MDVRLLRMWTLECEKWVALSSSSASMAGFRVLASVSVCKSWLGTV